MKKGFILALLMVAMVALVLPVAARAPIVNMPKVIIGDSDAADLGGGKGIMRYLNAVNLKNPTFVDWNNDDTYTSDLFKAYLYNPQTLADPDVVAAQPARLVDTLTSVEYAAIFASKAIPAASACITSHTGAFDFFWLSLLDTTRHPAITNAYTAVPATDGVTPDTYNKSVDMVFVAGVTSGTAQIVASSATLTVVCQSGATDKATIGRDEEAYTFTGGVDGWTYSTVPPLAAAPQYTTATGIGFNIATAATAITHGSWKSPSNLAGSSAMAGRVYRASAVLSSNAANADVCPGYRLTFANDGFSHFGAMVMKTKVGVVAPEINTPVTGANFNARVYWAVPTTLGDFGDAEGQATFNAGGIADLRKYFVTFDALATAGDVGNIVMEELTVSSFPRPATKTKVVAWGSAAGEIAFNAATTAGGWAKDVDAAGFITGNLTRNAGTMVLNLKNGSGSRYLPALAQGYTALGLPAGQLAPVTGHLYRFSYGVVAAVRNATPCYRVSINGVDLTPGVGLAYRNMFWSDFQSFSNMTPIAKQQFFLQAGQTVSPGAPNLATDPAGPSVIETYAYSHTVAAASSTSYHNIFPLISLVDKGLWTVGGSVWPDPTTDMTVSSAGWEDLGADY